jgi:Flp pilus assembly protein TadD
VVFVTWPRGDIGLWSLDHFNTGLRAFKTDDIETAQRELDLAYAYVQTNAEINFALGNLWLARGDRNKAKAFYRRTIELEPRHANAWNNLGFLALQEKLWPFAAHCLGLAVEYEPEDAKAHYLLARALQGKGDIVPARAALEYALGREPQRPEFLALRAELDAPVPQ